MLLVSSHLVCPKKEKKKKSTEKKRNCRKLLGEINLSGKKVKYSPLKDETLKMGSQRLNGDADERLADKTDSERRSPDDGEKVASPGTGNEVTRGREDNVTNDTETTASQTKRNDNRELSDEQLLGEFLIVDCRKDQT